MSQLDLASLSVRREAVPLKRRNPRFWFARYFVPFVLLGGFATLIGWAARDYVFPPKSVTTIPVFSARGTVAGGRGELFRAAGWIEPRPTPIRIAALAPGIVRRLLVVEDQPIRAGDPIAELVDDDARLEVRRAQADLQLREAEWEMAQATLAAAQLRFEQPVHLQAALAEAEATCAEVETEVAALPFELRRAEAQRDFARLDYDRKINAQDSISQRAIDEAKSILAAAEAAVDQLRQRELSLRAQQTGLASRRDALKQQLVLLADETRAKDEALANLKAAGAQVEQARVALANAELRLERMTVKSPVEGRVYRLIAQPGASLGPNLTTADDFDGSTVVTLYQPGSLQVRADVRFENLPQIRLGQPVEISNPALAQPLTGRVLFASSQADIQKNTLQVKIALDAASELLKPEMLVDATFFQMPGASAADTAETTRIYAPRNVIGSNENGSFVWVADQRTSRAQRIAVTTGVQLGDLLEITSGLNPSQQLIDSGTEDLRPRQRIRIVKREPPAAVPTTDTRPRALSTEPLHAPQNSETENH